MAILHPNYSNLDYDAMAKKIGLKVKHIPVLLSSFLEDAQPICIKLKAAIDANDYEMIRGVAHALKGSSGNMRFNDIYEMATEMEFAARECNTSFEYAQYLDAISTAIDTVKI
ncbi:MAG: histidine kinase [Sulfurimonas sp.]|nr:MAG: histidine kinase [Sulfurimonas sp.]